MDKSLYTSVQVEPSETFVSFVNSAGGGLRFPFAGASSVADCHASQACGCWGLAGVLESVPSCHALLPNYPNRGPRPHLRLACSHCRPQRLPNGLTCADEATDVTINLKDFKAMLGLCENLGAQVKLAKETSCLVCFGRCGQQGSGQGGQSAPRTACVAAVRLCLSMTSSPPCFPPRWHRSGCGLTAPATRSWQNRTSRTPRARQAGSGAFWGWTAVIKHAA